LADIYIDGDACPVREEIYRVAALLRLNVSFWGHHTGWGLFCYESAAEVARGWQRN
jgi:hypothetical protein